MSAWQSRIDASASIIQNVPLSYSKAKDAGDLLFFPSDVHTVEEANVKFQIRLCPALQHKPAMPAPHFDETISAGVGSPKAAKPNPFAPPYNANLYVGALRGEEDDEVAEYVVLLNKYSVVPNHFLLVTKEFQSQASPLSSHDLVQAYLLLLTAKQAGQHYFAFFNCGDLSGASQGHKHLQLLPMEDANGPPTERIACGIKLEKEDKPFSISRVPYANYVRRLPSLTTSTPPSELAEVLQQAYLNLLELVIHTVRHDAAYPPGRPSYNFLLTDRHMHLIPRREENHVLASTREPLSLNSLAFAGMLLVKSESELEAVKAEGILPILRSVALPHLPDSGVPAHEQDV